MGAELSWDMISLGIVDAPTYADSRLSDGGSGYFVGGVTPAEFRAMSWRVFISAENAIRVDWAVGGRWRR